MATFKETVGKRRATDGLYNVRIRVTQNRKVKYISTTLYVGEGDLNRKGEIRNLHYIDLVTDLIRSYRNKCEAYGESLRFLDVDDVVSLVTKEEPKEFRLDMVRYTRDYADKLRAEGHGGTASVYDCAVSSLVRFAGKESVDVRELTASYLNRWVQWIQDQPAPHGRRGSRAPSLYITQMRAMHNRAKREYNDEDLGVIRIPGNPFAKVELPRTELPRKRAITAEQVRAIAALPDSTATHRSNSRHDLARDVFLLSFYLIGMNAVDLYSCSDYDGERITYERTKTRTRRADRAEISIKVEPEARALLEKYGDPSGRRVFAFYRMYTTVNNFSAALNKGLKEVGKAVGVDDLQFYAARHSWATIAVNEVEVDKYTVHSALNHVDEAMRVTDLYVKKSWAPMDRANRQVLDYIWG